jgi:hypothetical protein
VNAETEKQAGDSAAARAAVRTRRHREPPAPGPTPRIATGCRMAGNFTGAHRSARSVPAAAIWLIEEVVTLE